MIKLIPHTKIVNFNASFSIKKSEVVRNTYSFVLFFILTALLPSISYAKKIETLKDSIFKQSTEQTNTIYILEGTTFSGFQNNLVTHVESKKKETNDSIIYISPKTTFFYSKTAQKNFSLVHIKDTPTYSLSKESSISQQKKLKNKEEKTQIKTQNVLEYPFQNPHSFGTYNPNKIFINSKTTENSFNKQLLKAYNSGSLNCINIEKYNDSHFIENNKYCYLLVVNFYTRPPPFLS